MALRYILFDDITEQHLRGLIENKAAESLDIDYKRQTYGGKDSDRKEFLADVSSFANAGGGDIVIGMAEKEGVPIAIAPFTEDADKERRRLEQMARDGIEPRIIGLAVRIVPVSGGVVLVVRIPKSYNPPHRVAFQGAKRFYARSSGGRYEPNVEELRNLFLATPHLHERIRAFRMERIARILARETPVPLFTYRNRFFVLHVVPYSAFGMGQALVLEQAMHSLQFLAPLGSEFPSGQRFNFDGFIALTNPDKDAPAQRAYCQVFRSGAVENVAALDARSVISTQKLSVWVKDYASKHARALGKCGAAPPYAVLVSLLGMRGVRFGLYRSVMQEYTLPADRDHYHFAEGVFETLPRDDPEARAALRPTLHHMASLMGHAHSTIA
jgi:hypothetical protein